MKILVLACRVRPNETSGGLCTSKYLTLLGKLSTVQVITPERDEHSKGEPGSGEPGDAAGQPRVYGSPSGTLERASRFVSAIPSGWLNGKLNAAFCYTTGFHPEAWARVAFWRRVFPRKGRVNGDPSLIFAFGAGMDFSPHMALASEDPEVPWVAYYHDPWPGHLYPEPYRWRWSIPGWHQERWHRHILRRATALAFPSARLRDWILCGDLEPLKEKAFVLPHLATGPELSSLRAGQRLPAGFDANDFQVTHAGTLLRHRSPFSLLEGFRRFVEREPERRLRARLWLVGWVDRHIQPDRRWKELTDSEQVRVIVRRVPYEESMEVLYHSVAGVILEAIAEESPFYPGKLADLLYLRKPVLAITPRKSTVRDMLGPDYPLLCNPDDPAAVAEKLELLWMLWKQGRLHEVAPGESVCRLASEEEALSELERIERFLGVNITRKQESSGSR